MNQPFHPYFTIGRNLFIGCALAVFILDALQAKASIDGKLDITVFLSSCSTINIFILSFSSLLMLIGLWENRKEVAIKPINKSTVNIKALEPEDHEAFELWLQLDLSHKHLRKSAQVQQFLAYQKAQQTKNN